MSGRVEVRDSKNFGLGTWAHGGNKSAISLVDGKFSATWNDKQLESAIIKCGVLGNLSHADFIKRVDSYAREMLKDNIAVFPYPREGEVQELWVFEAFLSNGPIIRRAKEALKKNPLVEGYKKVIDSLKVALAIQKYKKGKVDDLEKAILKIKKEFFLFQAKEYASLFLPTKDDNEAFLAIIKDNKESEDIFEMFLGRPESLEKEGCTSYDLLASSKFQADYQSSSLEGVEKPSKVLPNRNKDKHLTRHKIAESLWLDRGAIIDDDMIQKVNIAAAYLNKEGYELKGIKADGNCFCNAFLKSYARLSRKIPILDSQKNKISYLRDVIAAKYDFTPEGNTGPGHSRASQIRRDKEWLTTSEGGLLANALSIPIRMITVNKDNYGCGINDMLIFSELDKLYQEWNDIQEKDKPKEYVIIVDIGGHFIYAEPFISKESGRIPVALPKINRDKFPAYGLHSMLLKAMAHEFLDQSILAAEAYVNLAEKTLNHPQCALPCLKKALSFFHKKNPSHSLDYSHFLEKLDKAVLLRLHENTKDAKIKNLLDEKDAIRMVFEKALLTLVNQSKQQVGLSCFICFNPEELSVCKWLYEKMVFDLEKISVQPVFCLRDLSSFDDHNHFQEKIRTTDRVIIICTPDLKKKCEQEPQSCIAQEIRIAKERFKDPNKHKTISLLYLKGNRKSSCPTPFFEPIFAGLNSDDQPIEIFNYYDIAFEFFAPIREVSPRIAQQIKEIFLQEVQNILRGSSNKQEVYKWKEYSFTRELSLSSIEEVQKMYKTLEPKEREEEITKILKSSYLEFNTIHLLLGDKKLSIEKYTSLAIINKKEIEKKKREVRSDIELEALFDCKQVAKSDEKRIVLYGSAGIGKSILCHYASYKWAQGMLWNQFSAIFWVKFRNINEKKYPLDKDHTIYEILSRECSFRSEEYNFLLKDENFRKKCLLILDGYDELSSEKIEFKDSNGHLSKILCAFQNDFPHILITTRHQKVSGFENYSEMEILGFDPRAIQKYVDDFFPDEKSKEKKIFQNQLKNPLIHSLCHIPIHLEIFCSLAYEGKFFSMDIPVTITTIYDALTDQLVKRYLVDRTATLRKDIEEDAFPKENPEVSDVFKALEKVAWKGFKNRDLYVNTKSREISNIFKEYKLQTSSVTKIGPFIIHEEQGHFIHSTFQEYFAGVHLAKLYRDKVQKARKVLKGVQFNPRYQFVLYMATGYLSSDQKSLKAFFDDFFLAPRDLGKSYEIDLFTRCVNECVNSGNIDQYDFMVKHVANYLKDPKVRADLQIELLINSQKIISDAKVFDPLVKKINAFDVEVVKTLAEVSAKGDPIPQVLVEAAAGIIEKCQQPLHFQFKVSAAQVLAQTFKRAKDFSQEILAKLINISEDLSINQSTKETLGLCIGEFIHLNEQHSEKILKYLSSLITISSNANTCVFTALGEAAKGTKPYALQAMKTLICSYNKSADFFFPIKAITDAIKGGHPPSQEICDILSKLLSETSDNATIRSYCSQALEVVVKKSESFGQKAFQILFDAFNNSKVADQNNAIAIALAEIAKEKTQFSETARNTLLQACTDTDSHYSSKNAAILALGLTSKKDHSFIQQVIETLEKVVNTIQAHGDTKEIAFSALNNIIHGETQVSNLAMNIIFCAIKETSRSIKEKIFAVFILFEIAIGESLFADEATETLIQILEDSKIELNIKEKIAQQVKRVEGIDRCPSREGFVKLIFTAKNKSEKVDITQSSKYITRFQSLAERSAHELNEIRTSERSLSNTKPHHSLALQRIQIGSEFFVEISIQLLEKIILSIEVLYDEKMSSALVLAEIVKENTTLSAKCLEFLSLALQKPKLLYDSINAVCIGLKKIVKESQIWAQKALQILINALANTTNFDTKLVATSVLMELSKQEISLSQETLRLAIETYRKVSESYTKQSAYRIIDKAKLDHYSSIDENLIDLLTTVSNICKKPFYQKKEKYIIVSNLKPIIFSASLSNLSVHSENLKTYIPQNSLSNDEIVTSLCSITLNYFNSKKNQEVKEYCKELVDFIKLEKVTLHSVDVAIELFHNLIDWTCDMCNNVDDFETGLSYLENFCSLLQNFLDFEEKIQQKVIPILSLAYHNLGSYLHVIGKKLEAEEFFNRSIKLNRTAGNLCEFGHFLLVNERYEEAIIFLKESAELKKSEDRIYYGKMEMNCIHQDIGKLVRENEEVRFPAWVLATQLLSICYLCMENKQLEFG